MAKKKFDNAALEYLSSSWEEFGKVTWPTKEQSALLTAIVVGVSLLVVVFIGLSDLGLSQLNELITDKL